MNNDNTFRFSNPLSPIEDIYHLFHWVKLYPNTNLRTWILNGWSFISNDFDGVPLYRKKKQDKFSFKHTIYNSAFTQTNKSYLNKHNISYNLSNIDNNKSDDTPLEEIIIESNCDNTNDDQYRFSPLVNIKKNNTNTEFKHTHRPTKSLFF